ncbi:MAG: iron-containing alcohol dehydrogenase [Chloroflexota bacterium]
MTGFSYISAAQQVIFGAGALAQLSDAVDRFGRQRLLLCTLERFQNSGLVTHIEDILGRRLAAVYAQVQPHVPQQQVEAALALAIEHNVDAVIGLGGGSSIGMAKAVSLALEEHRTGSPARAASPTDQPLVPVIAIPTTYAGSEMTPIYGVTRVEEGITRKVTVTDARVTPKLILYDPELTLTLPPYMTASTGINALAHCIEAVYSITRNPLSTAAALEGARHITQVLPQAVANGSDLAARTEMLLGAHLAAVALSTVKMGLHHGLCHVLGGTAGVPHGLANSIMLPHVMRFNADATAWELAALARAIGVAGNSEAESAEQAAQTVYNLVNQIGLPQRLRDVGVAETDLPHLARVALKSQAVQNNPKPITGAPQIESVFRAAW